MEITITLKNKETHSACHLSTRSTIHRYDRSSLHRSFLPQTALIFISVQWLRLASNRKSPRSDFLATVTALIVVILKYLRPYNLSTLQLIASTLEHHEERLEARWLEENYIIPALGFPSSRVTSLSLLTTQPHCLILPPRDTYQPDPKDNFTNISIRAKSEEDVRRIWELYCHAI